MNGTSQSQVDFRVDDIFPASLLEYAQSAVFPWSQDKPLNAAEVGQGLIRHTAPVSDWDIPEVKASLMRLVDLGIDNVRQQLHKFPEWVTTDGDNDMSAPDRNIGMILILDMGARRVCTGVNARYAYEFFQQIPIYTIKFITDRGMASLDDWEAAGIDKNQAIMRALVMLGALVHTENPEDHEHHLRMTETLRKQYERLTRTRDPYRQSLSRDLEDINLYAKLTEEGPPQGKNVHMTDVMYWVMRFFASNIAFLRHFKRSPFRNVAMGRDDTEEELQWLKTVGVNRTKEDEEVRELIKEDIKHGRWRPLQL